MDAWQEMALAGLADAGAPAVSTAPTAIADAALAAIVKCLDRFTVLPH
jgi:hypothetical protein